MVLFSIFKQVSLQVIFMFLNLLGHWVCLLYGLLTHHWSDDWNINLMNYKKCHKNNNMNWCGGLLLTYRIWVWAWCHRHFEFESVQNETTVKWFLVTVQDVCQHILGDYITHHASYVGFKGAQRDSIGLGALGVTLTGDVLVLRLKVALSRRG